MYIQSCSLKTWSAWISDWGFEDWHCMTCFGALLSIVLFWSMLAHSTLFLAIFYGYRSHGMAHACPLCWTPGLLKLNAGSLIGTWHVLLLVSCKFSCCIHVFVLCVTFRETLQQWLVCWPVPLPVMMQVATALQLPAQFQVHSALEALRYMWI